MRTVELSDGVVRLIDQRRLPANLEVLECRDHHAVAEAIRTLAVRGAPAIGVSAAAAMALAARALARNGADGDAFTAGLQQAAALLKGTRPTAVNLAWGVQRALDRAAELQGAPAAAVADALWHLALLLADEDVAANRRIGEHGQELIADGDGIITHCNTGALACVDIGTALGVIRTAHEAGKRVHVFVDETRPVLQGARLTAWECGRLGIPATLITDSMAAYFLAQGRIQIALVGADRIAANGDTANKIGTYGLAILCREHGVPFYVAAPTSTVDLALATGAAIEIEERDPAEVTACGGAPIAPAGCQAANPAFDVTPQRYITGIITERGVVYPPYTLNLARVVKGGDRRA